MLERPTILVGALGTGTAFGAVSAIRRNFSRDVRVLGIDINPPSLVTASLLCDQTFQVGPSDAPEFAGRLVALIHEHRIHAFLPLLPGEIDSAIRIPHQAQIPPSFEFLFGSLALAGLTLDKLTLFEWLRKQGLPTPMTALAGLAFGENQYFLKPRAGAGSRGARRVSALELSSLPEARDDAWIIQEICDGTEVTVDAFSDPELGFFRALARERIEVKSGVSTKCRIREDPELAGFAASIASALGVSGSFCFQVIGKPGSWRITDLNPRPGAATAMSVACGNDFFGAMFARWLGRDYSGMFGVLDRPAIVTRQYADFRMD